MKALSLNKQTIYYAQLTGVTDQVIGGLKTGEKVKTYSDPTAYRINVSAARGTADIEQFGINDNYDRTLATSDMTCPFTEETILWIGILPTDAQGNVVAHNYRVTKVARSLNSITYAVRKVSVTK